MALVHRIMASADALWRVAIDFLMPQEARVKELEEMDVTALRERTRRAESVRFNSPKTVSALSYKDPLVRRAVWELKYRGNRKIAKLLGALLYEEILEILQDETVFANFTDPMLVPIPISESRRRERGFNQSELLAQEIVAHDATVFEYAPKTLSKIKDTLPQTKTKTKKEREENLAGCFRTDENAARGRNIILIDDVATTGSTLREAARALSGAGARRVIAFTVAH